MLTMVLDAWHHVCAAKPAWLSKTPDLTFITIHHFWIVGCAIVASLGLYIRGGSIRYIDALFLGSGAATQSGLNTIDINLLSTWQQVVIYFIPSITNPITINSFVVLWRLFYFEKRFQNIARESTRQRRSIAKTISKSKPSENGLDNEERGVNGRNIVVMHQNSMPNGATNGNANPVEFDAQHEKDKALTEEKAISSGSSKETTKEEGSYHDAEEGDGGVVVPQRTQTQIKFADVAKLRDGDDDIRIPTQRTKEDHIAFLERQRNSDAGEILRIPGPRDADAGVAPQAVDDEDTINPTLSRRASTFGSIRHSADIEPLDSQGQDNIPRRNITITEPARPAASEHAADDVVAAKHTLGALRFRKPRILKGEKLHESESRRSNTLQNIRSALSKEKEAPGMPYLSWVPTIGRNSAFADMTEEQREELGGIEYRALKTLAVILVLYNVGFSLLGIVGLVPWILRSEFFGNVVESVGQGRVWWGIFTANSAFTDLGFTLTPDSMISFKTATWPLFLMSFLIVIGNTGFPIMLRVIIWVTSQIVPKKSGIWEELKFLLDHPRRCFTLLFPTQATWWLFWILVIFNVLDLVLFIVLDLGNTVVTQLPTNVRMLDGWFQAISTRTAGFAVVNLSLLHPAIQVSYMIMMYISVLPIAISVRRTNVYEEKSLGIYSSASEENIDESEPSYVGAHLRRQLSYDLWYIFMGFFIISISEGSRIQSGDPGFTMFNVLFEIVSAYGTVGLSLGYPTINASFSAEFGVVAKLVIIAMQIRGRHRGLPYQLDKAIMLPSEHLQQKESEDAALRMHARRNSTSTATGLAPVSSGATKVATRTGRDRSENRPEIALNLLGGLFHPGPTIPNSHRKINKGDPSPRLPRRNSTTTAEMRGRSARSLSPNLFKTGTPFGRMEARTVGVDDIGGRGTEGRRHFFEEGINPAPGPVSPVPEGVEKKET